MHISEEKLKGILMESGVISDKAFADATTEAHHLGQTITDVLIGREEITEEYFAELMEPYVGVPVVDLKQVPLDLAIVSLLPESFAKGKGVLVFAHEPGLLAKVAMVDPLDYDTIEFIRAKLGCWVEPYLTTRKSLRFGLKQYKETIGKEFNDIITESVKKFAAESGETDLVKMAEAVPIVTILDSIVEHAISLNASDIHFEPLPKEVLVRFRVDGILQEVLSLGISVAPILVARVKILAGLRVDEHKTPQDGRFRFEGDESGAIDVRANVMPVMHGEKVEMRLLKSQTRPLSLSELGLSNEAIRIVEEEIKKPHGMILSTGPTGHGKTTTLYAIVHLLNTPKVNITTIEDPIEYEVGRINQTQVNVKAGITFANGLRALLRQNPDIIMVGEIRDNETVEIAVHAALTGHLVLSTLHTNDAPSAIPRFIDMGAPAFLLASTINLVIAQRLVRRICASCTESYEATEETRRLIGAQIALAGMGVKTLPKVLYRGKGCNVCGLSGFSGQIGIYELLRVNEGIRELILKSADASEIRRRAIADGMQTMFEDGLAKVERGVTTIEEILRVVKE